MALTNLPGFMGRRRIVLGIMILGLGLAIAAASPRAALAQAPQQVARVVSVQGTVEAQRAGGTQWVPVKLNDTFSPGDRIRVLDKSRADIAMLDQSVLRLNANTTITIQAPKEERTGAVDLVRGAAHFFSRGPRSLDVQTPYTIAGVRGTEFFITVEADRTLLTVFEGTVVAENPAGSLTLASGQSAVAEAGKAPVLRVVARPRDAVQWALYYPPVIMFRPDEFPAGPGWQGMVRQSIEFSTKGDLQKAFDSIATAPPNITDPRFFAYRASLLLAVGRVDEAGADIQRALALNPNDSNALSLQTIIAVVQNEKDKALEVAQKAVQANPNSATAQIALSYAQQARFDLDGARASLEQAVKLEPQNALAWARLAELWSSSGELRKALDAAQKAVALEPNLSRTQTVLGFAYLTQVKTKQAREAFEKAIALDQADPLPRLGLGLAKIRDGDLNEGSRELEVAASLDPNNALVRSYLGKAYFEEKRTTLDEREYNVAKELDPKDPTPYFYDAITKQTTNRPVEALRELEKAIELNDNRAVYRSRLLLDADLAARSASLARIYSDLGFQQLALVEGWKSANTDPTNFSAHRFLADSYAALPRHEIARVSELLQSQLLQPQNMTPIQPRLAESNLFLISAGGPGALSFNEFNPLFNRDGVTVQGSGLLGEHNTFSGEGIISGIYKMASFSAGYSHFGTDGWRTNAGQKDDIANAFVQYELTPQTSVQAEYRYRDNEFGDLQQRFFPEDFNPRQTTREIKRSIRLGGRHAFSPDSTIIGSFIYQNADGSLRVDAPARTVSFAELTSPLESLGAELQHLFRSRYLNLTTGAGYVNINGRFDQVVGVILPPPPLGPGGIREVRSSLSADLEHYNIYAYAYINLLKDVTFTAGVSYDNVDGDSGVVPGGSKDQVNPKFGITWNPFPATTVRAAVFRVFRRTTINDQTIEPTQVAGFNQFFRDNSATDAWRYGGAIDQKITRDLFGGVEFSKRDLTRPIIDASNPARPITQEVETDEYLARAYLLWTPHPWLALRAEYIFERVENDPFRFDRLKEVDTHRVPLGISFFHPSGISTSLTGTYVYQDADFVRLQGGPLVSESDGFWLLDAALSYRLPNRYGFITVGATNLLDKQFRFYDTNPNNPSIQPQRTAFVRVTLAFP